MSRALQSRLRFIYLFEAAKARLLMDGSGGTFPGEGESGETVQAARMVARCWRVAVGRDVCQSNMAKPGWWAIAGD